MIIFIPEDQNMNNLWSTKSENADTVLLSDCSKVNTSGSIMWSGDEAKIEVSTTDTSISLCKTITDRIRKTSE